MNDIAYWIAPLATIAAALMTASNLGSRITGIGFVVFTLGSLAWLWVGWARDDGAMIWQNIVLTILNLFGIWRWLGRQSAIEQGGRAAQAESKQTPGEGLFPVSLLGQAEVRGADGSMGRLVDAMAGAQSGEIRYLVLSQGGVGGVGETLRRLSWHHVRIDEDAVVTGLSQSQVDQLTTLDRDGWPTR